MLDQTAADVTGLVHCLLWVWRPHPHSKYASAQGLRACSVHVSGAPPWCTVNGSVSQPVSASARRSREEAGDQAFRQPVTTSSSRCTSPSTPPLHHPLVLTWRQQVVKAPWPATVMAQVRQLLSSIRATLCSVYRRPKMITHAVSTIPASVRLRARSRLWVGSCKTREGEGEKGVGGARAGAGAAGNTQVVC